MSVVLSQSNGTAGGAGGVCFCVAPPALTRASPWSVDALSIAASIFGSLSWARLLLPWLLTMFLPLNVTSSIDCGSVKSLNQPAEPQIATFFGGTWHHSV